MKAFLCVYLVTTGLGVATTLLNLARGAYPQKRDPMTADVAVMSMLFSVAAGVWALVVLRGIW